MREKKLGLVVDFYTRTELLLKANTRRFKNTTCISFWSREHICNVIFYINTPVQIKQSYELISFIEDEINK